MQRQSELLHFLCLSLCFLWCAGSPGNPTEKISETSDQTCMLQGALRHSRGMAEDLPLWQQREYHLIPHHKSGSAMCHQAAHAMERSTMRAGMHPLRLHNSPETMGLALNSLMLQTPKPKCMAHITRNPFEMVVSGYLYHMAVSGAETWLHKPLGQVAKEYSDPCKPSFSGGRMLNYCEDGNKHTYAESVYWRGGAQVFNSSKSGSIAAWLPAVMADETYPGYLKRIGLDGGLIASSIWASDANFAPMRFTSDYVESQPCSINVCFEDFYKDCKTSWERVLRAWGIPESQAGGLLKAAMKSCPDSNPLARKHSSSRWMKKKGLPHLPEHLMVKRLRELDRVVLNGTIAALERHLGCSVSRKYEEPAKTRPP